LANIILEIEALKGLLKFFWLLQVIFLDHSSHFSHIIVN